jgi:hypothetical protein
MDTTTTNRHGSIKPIRGGAVIWTSPTGKPLMVMDRPRWYIRLWRWLTRWNPPPMYVTSDEIEERQRKLTELHARRPGGADIKGL